MKRILSLILVLMMLLSLMPMSAFADESTETEEATVEETVEEVAEEATTEETVEEVAEEAATEEEPSSEEAVSDEEASTEEETTTEETVEESGEESTEESTESATEETGEEANPLALDGSETEEWSVTLNDAEPNDNPLLYTISWQVTVPESANAVMWLYMSGFSGDPDPEWIRFSSAFSTSEDIAIEPGSTLYYQMVLEDCNTGNCYSSEEKSVTAPALNVTEGALGRTYNVKAGELYHFSIWTGLYVLNTTGENLDVYTIMPYDSTRKLDEWRVRNGYCGIRSYDTMDVYVYARQDATFCFGSVVDADVPELDCGENDLTVPIYRFTAEEAGLYRLTSDALIAIYNSYGYQSGYSDTDKLISLKAEESCYLYVLDGFSPITVNLKKITPSDAQKVELDTEVTPQANQLYIFTAPAASVY